MNQLIQGLGESSQREMTLSDGSRKPLSEMEQKTKARFSVITKNGIPVPLSEQEQRAAFFGHYSLKHASSLILNEAKDSCFATHYYKPETPTLSMAANIYGSSYLTCWLQDNLAIVAENTGTKGRWTEMQIMISANMLREKFDNGEIHLNMREVLLFFYLWMSGKFGHFYGTADIQLIGMAADEFLVYRYEEICRIERIQEAQHRAKQHDEMVANAATPEQRREAIINGLRKNPEAKDMMLKLNLVTREELKEMGIDEPNEPDEDEVRRQHEEEFRKLLEAERARKGM